jgi:hypothetical protein
MTKKHEVKDSELEQVNGGGGVMDLPDKKELDQSQGGESSDLSTSSDSVDFAQTAEDLSNDMLRQDTDRP